MDLSTVRGVEHARKVRLAIDAMGGDHAPDEVVAGSLLYAAEHPDDDLILVGDVERVRARLAAQGWPLDDAHGDEHDGLNGGAPA